MSGYFDLDPDYEQPPRPPLVSPSVPQVSAAIARPTEGRSLRERHEAIALEMSLLVRDAREDIETKRAELAAAIAYSVDIEHSAKKLQHDAHVSRRHRVIGRFPPPPRPFGDGMG